MHAFEQGITIADCSHPEMPLIYANEAFTRITGYSLDETLGKNCRFLQVCSLLDACVLLLVVLTDSRSQNSVLMGSTEGGKLSRLGRSMSSCTANVVWSAVFDCEGAQGEGTDGETVGKMRKAMREGSPCVVQLLNYKKNGVRLTDPLAEAVSEL